jgi:hypothetical protein
LIVAMLALIALWRIGPPADGKPGEVGARGTGGVLEPLTRLADVLTTNAVGRRASLENVPVRQLTSESTFWAGELDADPVFVVLDPAARRRASTLEPGARVTLVGTVEPMPDPAAAARTWGVDQATAQAVRDIGVFLRVTEVRP